MSLSGRIFKAPYSVCVFIFYEFSFLVKKPGLAINEFAGVFLRPPIGSSNYSKTGEAPRNYAMLVLSMGEVMNQGTPLADFPALCCIVPQPLDKGIVRQFDMFRVIKSES